MGLLQLARATCTDGRKDFLRTGVSPTVGDKDVIDRFYSTTERIGQV